MNVHLVGIGGINMSAVAKLLLAAGVRVSGSDVEENEQTRKLRDKGAEITIGHAPKNVPIGTNIVVYSSAVPETNPERVEARGRGIPERTNFEYLGEWFKEKKTIVVAGTHGKSTTTAMLGLILERAKLDPTVVVGSKVPSFADGNLRIGASDLFVVEGDEYARHFLAFHPFGIVLNNIELDHTDVFPTLLDMTQAFRELFLSIHFGGLLVANMEDPNVAKLVAQERTALETLQVRVIPFPQAGSGVTLTIPGQFNRTNAAGAATMAKSLGADEAAIRGSLEAFTGIWRRFEFLGERNGVRVYSDYGHHPTAVRETLAAAKELFPASRVVLCFQPHHRNRTKRLFLDFVPSFDLADILILCEVYDVAGRDATEDADISAKDLVDAIVRHDADRGVKRTVEFAENPEKALARVRALMASGDIAIIMGAGDIDDAARSVFASDRRERGNLG